MFNPQTITLLFFIILFLLLIFYPSKKKETLQNNQSLGFNFKRDILSKVDVFTKYMLLNQ